MVQSTDEIRGAENSSQAGSFGLAAYALLSVLIPTLKAKGVLSEGEEENLWYHARAVLAELEQEWSGRPAELSRLAGSLLHGVIERR